MARRLEDGLYPVVTTIGGACVGGFVVVSIGISLRPVGANTADVWIGVVALVVVVVVVRNPMPRPDPK